MEGSGEEAGTASKAEAEASSAAAAAATPATGRRRRPPPQPAREGFVDRRHAVLGVEEQQRDVGPPAQQARGEGRGPGSQTVLQRRRRRREDELPPPRPPLSSPPAPRGQKCRRPRNRRSPSFPAFEPLQSRVTWEPGRVPHQGLAGAREAVEEGRLAHVGPAEEDDDGERGGEAEAAKISGQRRRRRRR